MKKLVNYLYLWLVVKPKNFMFKLRVAKTIFKGSFFVISGIKIKNEGATFEYKLRTLGLPNDEMRHKVLSDVRKFYKNKDKTIIRIINKPQPLKKGQ